MSRLGGPAEAALGRAAPSATSQEPTRTDRSDGRHVGDPADATVPGAVGGRDGTEPGHVEGQQADAHPGPRPEVPRGTGAFLYAVLLLIPIGFFLAPLVTLIIWRMRRHEPFLDFHGRQSLDLFFGAVLGAGIHLTGRYLTGMAGVVLQWLGLAVIAVQGALVVWGMMDAGGGRMRRLPLSLPILRWPQGPGPESPEHA